MGIADLMTHVGGLSATGAGALIAAWFVWRLWRRLLRAVIACVVVGLVVYVAFPGVAQQFVNKVRAPATSTTDTH